MDLTGFKTVIVALVGGPLATLSIKYLGQTLDPATQTWLIGAIMTALMVLMRIVTKTPIGTAVPLPKPAAALFVTLLLAPLFLGGCAFLSKVTSAVSSPQATVYIDAAVDVAVATAEQKGISAGQINSIAHLALNADQGTNSTLAGISGLINTQIGKLNLPAGDSVAIDILETALSVGIEAQIAASAKTGTAIAGAQLAIADVLNAVIGDTGG